MRAIALSLAVLCILTSCDQNKPATSLPEVVDFNFHVRPILIQNCYLCHGPDPGSRKAGLRLDTFEGATAALKEGGFAIVPGHPGKSKLVDRIKAHDPDQVMPPPDTKLTLSERDIAILTKWIDQGAQWKKHWAFIPPVLPDLEDLPEGKSEIDFLLEEKIKDFDIDLAPEAEKNALIRRVSYTLTGLPPTTEELHQYLGDKSADSYEKMIDRYLGSNRFGEKWARHWMDVVRYAETKGHEFDYTIAGAWRYRDYLIRAFNEDVAYDQFVREHLAGDLLSEVRRNAESGTNESQFGTAFLTMAEGKHSPVDLRQDEADRIDNMIDVTTKAFQALTVSCARCHDHKFDPISTADYYSMYGIMESSRFSPVPAELTVEKELSVDEIKKLDDYIRKMVTGKWSSGPQVTARPVAIVSQATTDAYTMIGDFRGRDLNGWKSDGFAFGDKTILGKPIFNARNELVGLSPGKASSRAIGMNLFGALRSPDFTIDKDFIGVSVAGKMSSVRIIIDNFQLISDPIYGEMDQRVDKEGGQRMVFDVASLKGRKAYIEILPGFFKQHVYHLQKDSYVEVDYVMAFNGKWIEPAPVSVDHDVFPSPDQIAVINRSLKGRPQRQSDDVIDALQKCKTLASGIADSTFFNGIKDGFGMDSKVFVRGSHQELGETSKRGFLSVIAGKDSVFDTRGSGRAELANAMLRADNPLTARVMVNRIWYYLFGRGIVETVDNFGLQGKLPTHPELLDFLAIKFQDDGWSNKKIIRYIMMTDAFKRSVSPGANARLKDPENLLFSHYPRRRLEAEQIRDGLLAVSGRLDLAMYGKPIPVHITDFMQGRGKPGKSGPVDGDGRRSIYQEVRRNFMEPMMLTFDRPVPFTTFGKRNVTNVPAQSLILMNDPFVIQQAEVMAAKLIAETNPVLEHRFEWIFERAYSRKPSLQEMTKAKEFLLQLARLHDVGEKDITNSLTVWKDYCHSVFNSKEFIYLI